MSDRLHPDSIRQLRDLVKLHGATAIIAATKQMGASLDSEKTRAITETDKVSLKAGPHATPLDKILGAITRNLREFGYTDVTLTAIREVYSAWKDGKPIPHGIIGMFARRQFEEHHDALTAAEDRAHQR